MAEVTIRIYCLNEEGRAIDQKEDFDLSFFGGVLPSAGDIILHPGVLRGEDRHKPENRRIWSVVKRVFNPKDNEGEYIALLVEERPVSDSEIYFVP